jgi:hypothetical protein
MKNLTTIFFGFIIFLFLTTEFGQVKAQNISVSNSLGVVKLIEKNGIGMAAGMSLSVPVHKYVDVGIAYQFAMSSKSPENEHSITQEEITTVYHYSQNELGIYGSLGLITSNRYRLKLRSGFLINRYVDNFLVPEHFIDLESNWKSYLGDHCMGWSFGMNISIENYFRLTESISLGFVPGINLYNSDLYNNFTGSVLLVYTLKGSRKK